MIADTSALVAILRNEPEAAIFAEALWAATTCRLSAATYVELAAVVERRHDPTAASNLDRLLARIEAVIEPVTVEQAKIAREAYREFGRGSGHPARLNFGDCFAYALAKALNEPLLFKGEDFARTDVARAV